MRRSFLNCSRGEATRIKLLADFPDTAWDLLRVYRPVGTAARLDPSYRTTTNACSR
ncbi:hypothetical protein [Streptomyces canus]|uniref:hypothetical protein n=1 Tax=Streptomyces canus TaxID=58343 RepID=UPI003D9A0CA1